MAKGVRRVELRLLSELMKNSRASDRELGKRLGISQPTVSRARNKLEKEGYVSEYTIIPNFVRLGYSIMAATFVKRASEYAKQDVAALFEEAQKWSRRTGHDTIMAMRGMGLGYDAVIISFHESYSAYRHRLREIKQFPYIDVKQIASFIVDLKDRHYRTLTFSNLADHLLTLEKASE